VHALTQTQKIKENETRTSQNNQVKKTHKLEGKKKHVTINTPQGRKGVHYI